MLDMREAQRVRDMHVVCLRTIDDLDVLVMFIISSQQIRYIRVLAS
jgi:hypothetical protein